MVDEILRGAEAEKQLNRLDSYDSITRNLPEDQEYLLVKITVNVPSIDMPDDTYLDFYVGDCRVISSTTGQEYDFENSIDFMENGVNIVMPGGSSDGWFGYVIDKNDLSPVMYYLSLDDKMLYYKLDKAYDQPEDVEMYASVIPEQNPVRDVSQDKGDWRNPYNMKENVNLDYKPSSAITKDIPFTGSIQVMEAYRGENAKYLLLKDICFVAGIS